MLTKIGLKICNTRVSDFFLGGGGGGAGWGEGILGALMVTVGRKS